MEQLNAEQLRELLQRQRVSTVHSCPLPLLVSSCPGLIPPLSISSFSLLHTHLSLIPLRLLLLSQSHTISPILNSAHAQAQAQAENLSLQTRIKPEVKPIIKRERESGPEPDHAGGRDSDVEETNPPARLAKRQRPPEVIVID